MFDQQTICPYTGLRSFTEEESLYFKGRDLQIDQITALLEQNKFLMVTGASGEGKSSLIFAGLIPNARAGFFKAKYTNWIVADFRPERSPVKNMAVALADKFELKAASVETELRRGFSSLIDLYTNSEYYIDEQDEQWILADDQVKKDKKRKAANLMILVDQFEEFFTNPENFSNEAPSQDSQVVVNLILETARIAIKKNIPVYVVCTMRSDFIGQCSAFRGLAEYIGFSQFFVPRLKRKDLKQVIEEPAILSGNRISQRLIERLVYDIAEGVDQLPILQHALSQVWLAADRGQTEMDLVHYAMVGGMPSTDLPDNDQQAFSDWFSQQPEYKKRYFQETGLNKVIEIHANILYETAWEYFKRNHPGKELSAQKAKRIIAIAFSCLTKIDNSRAVRNRMSLAEITGIINDPDCGVEVVGSVLSIYREEANSFVRPFKSADDSSVSLTSETVLDITHESLIRNWNKLNTWANREFEFYTTYLDFRKQLDRWKQSGKSSGYLLPIGPLTYFENWYNECKPNSARIKRYSEIEEDQQEALLKADRVLSDVRQFLKESAKRVMVTRAFMKYGPQRIAVGLAIVIMLFLTGFYWYDAEQKQNDVVIQRVRGDLNQLMKSVEVGNDSKVFPLIIQERYEPGHMMKYLATLEGKDRSTLSIEALEQLLKFDKHDRSRLVSDLIVFAGDALKEKLKEEVDYPLLLSEVNQFTTLLSYNNYYNPSAESEKALAEFSTVGYNVASAFYQKTEFATATISIELNYAIQQWLTFGHATSEQINAMLQIISPFNKGTEPVSFNTYYARGSYEINGRVANNFNGGYHTLASLYAAVGEVNQVISCFEKIKESGQDDYFTGSLFNNYNHILAIFYQFNYRDRVGEMIAWLGKNYPTDTPLTIYRNAVIRAGYMSHLYRVNISKNILRSYKGYFFPNLCLAKRTVFNALADDYEALIRNIQDSNERHYLLAMNKKRRAMFMHKYWFDGGHPVDQQLLESQLSEAISNFQSVSKDFLEETVSITIPYFGDGVRTRTYQRKQLFIYPDYMEGWFSWTYHTDLFFRYLDKHNLFSTLYSNEEDFSMLHFWIAKAFEVKPYSGAKFYDNNYPIDNDIFNRIISITDAHVAGAGFDRNLLYLIMANRLFESGDIEAALTYYKGFNKNNFAASRDKYEYLEKTFFLNQLRDLAVNLAVIGKQDEAEEIAEKFETQNQKVFAYIFMSEKLYEKATDPLTFVYLDSALSKSASIDFSQYNFGSNQAIDIRFKLIQLLSRIGGRDLNLLSDNYIKEIIEGNKFNGIFTKVYGVAEEGNMYLALSSIPPTLTEIDDLICRSIIMLQASRKKENEESRKRWTNMDDYIDFDFNYVFYLPS